MLLSGCSHSPSAELGAAQITSWTVRINTAGGFAGIGKGNVTISSDGKASATRPVARGETARPCEGTLAPVELQTVSDAVKHASSEGWKVPLDSGAPDAFEYTLELGTESPDSNQNRTVKWKTIKWYDNTQDKLPGDVKRLIQAVYTSMSQAMRNCP